MSATCVLDAFDAANEHSAVQGNAERQSRERRFVYRCSFRDCDKVFNRLYRFQRHRRQHCGEKPFVCTIGECEKAFTCRTYLNKHMKRPHPIAGDKCSKDEEKPNMKSTKTYECEECKKVFRYKFDLKTHFATHTGEKPFKCDLCNSAFALKSRLKSHQKIHKGYACNRESCDFKANKWTELQKHVADEHKIFYNCDLCEKKFHKPSALQLHSLTHGENQFKCFFDGCEKSFQRKSNLNLHVKSAHEKVTYKCVRKDCSKEFRHKSSLKKHLKIHDEPQKKKQTPLYVKRRCTAAVLSGFDPSEEERLEIFHADKHFRKEQIIIAGT